jgi:tRNA 5-methylaminomethyl-2-thiouridine biosynthesis bifunctional protein
MHNTRQPKTAIVIGGGIAGCATAYALKQKNIKVTLIERHQAIAKEASGNPFAVLYPRLTGQNTALEALNVQGYLSTLRLLSTLNLKTCGYQPFGVVQLAMNSQLAKQQANAMSRYKDARFHIEACSAGGLSEIAGVKLVHDGVYYKEAGGINLAQLCHVLIKDARIQTTLNTSALTLKKTPNQSWQVLDIQKHTIAEADIVVIANSYDALNFKQTAHLPLISARGQLSYLARKEKSNINTIICGDGYITPNIQGHHYLGASFSKHDMAIQLREKDHTSNLALLNAMCPTLFEAFANAPMQGRVAWRCQSKDYLPLAGPLLDAHALRTQTIFYNHDVTALPWLDGLYVNIGHGAKGFLTAPLCAMVIADLVTNTPNSTDITLINALQPNRFILRELGLKAIAQHLI